MHFGNGAKETKYNLEYVKMCEASTALGWETREMYVALLPRANTSTELSYQIFIYCLVG